jgi:UDP-glucuronate decarboxylase
MSRYIITGATGWLGRATLEQIFNKQGNLENVVCVASKSREEDLGFAKINTITFSELAKMKIENAIIFHLAYLTKDKNSTMTDEEYIKKNHQIRDFVANFLPKQKFLFYASSGATLHQNGHTLYGDLKLQDEEFFRTVCEEHSIKFLNTRIFNIIGKHIQNYKAYACSDFLLQLKENNAIKIGANCHVIRSYINISSLIEIIFAFQEDEHSEMFYSFETANHTLNLLELANITKNVLGFQNAEIIHNVNPELKENYYVGNPEKQNVLIERYKIKLQTLEDSIVQLNAYIETTFSQTTFS